MHTREGITGRDVLVGVVLLAAVAAAIVAIVTIGTTGRSGSDLAEEFTYSLAEAGRVDPKLIVCRQVGQFDSGFGGRARAIAVGRDGLIYLAGGRQVRVLAAETAGAGKAFRAVTRKTFTTDRPVRGLAVARDGTLYACADDRIELYRPAGTRQGAWEAPPGKPLLTSVAVDDDAGVFVADSGNKVVLRYDAAGKLLGRIGEKDPARNIPGLYVMSPCVDVAMGPDGLLRVTNPGRFRVEAYTADGDLELAWGRGGKGIEDFTGCCNPVNVAVLPGGEVVTCEKGFRRVKLYDARGEFLGVVAGPESFPGPTGAPPDGAGGGPTPVLDVAADTKGRVWVLDTNSGIVRCFVRKDKP